MASCALKRDSGDVTARAIRRAMPDCPVWKGTLDSHSYAPFAAAILNEGREAVIHQFEDAFIAHQWELIRKHQDWDPTQDLGEVFALHCPSGVVAMVLFRDPEELWHDKTLFRAAVLDDGETQAVRALIEVDRWRPFTDAG